MLSDHIAGAMNTQYFYSIFGQTFQISIRTIQDFSSVMLREYVLLANRCINLYVDILIVVLKLLKATRSMSNVDFLYAVHK